MRDRSDFWSRRKAQVAAEEEAEIDAVEAAQLAEDHAALEEKSDEGILRELDLPDPDTLQAGDDFKAFMAKAVPDRIRRRALRRLWVSNPALANLDGLLDYGEDFTDSAKVIENLQTAYQVGKGMLAHIEEMARQAEEKNADVTVEASESMDEIAQAESAPVEVFEAPESEPEIAMAEAPDPEVITTASEDSELQYPAPRRRMQFAFLDQPGGAS